MRAECVFGFFLWLCKMNTNEKNIYRLVLFLFEIDFLIDFIGYFDWFEIWNSNQIKMMIMLIWLKQTLFNSTTIKMEILLYCHWIFIQFILIVIYSQQNNQIHQLHLKSIEFPCCCCFVSQPGTFSYILSF